VGQGPRPNLGTWSLDFLALMTRQTPVEQRPQIPGTDSET